MASARWGHLAREVGVDFRSDVPERGNISFPPAEGPYFPEELDDSRFGVRSAEEPSVRVPE